MLCKRSDKHMLYLCFRPFKVSEDLKISHEAEEMASHAAGRKYNVTSGEGGKKKLWQSMGIGNSRMQYQKSVQVKASALDTRWNPRFQGNSGMIGGILFFFPEIEY
jgi:hypothetical protein